MDIYVIENAAQKLRSQFGLNDTEAVHIKTVLRKQNIITVYRDMSESIFGMSLRCKDYRFMLINSNTTRGRQHFTVAHELYHLYMEENPIPHLCCNGKTKTEVTADMFASAFLMPQQGLRSIIPAEELLQQDLSVATILKLEQYFSVSRNALLVRLVQLKIISQKCYLRLSVIPVIPSAIDNGYDTSLYQKGNKNLVIGDFGAVARTLFDEEKISEGHYRELLNQITYEQD
ncbi:MAG: ImmA/IrrE family metallo-endopeptidase [Paludibacteraceae bacterium]